MEIRCSKHAFQNHASFMLGGNDAGHSTGTHTQTNTKIHEKWEKHTAEIKANHAAPHSSRHEERKGQKKIDKESLHHDHSPITIIHFNPTISLHLVHDFTQA